MLEKAPITTTYPGKIINYKDVEYDDIGQTGARAHIAVVEAERPGRPKGESPIAWIPTDVILPPGTPVHLTEITTFKGKGSLTETFISPIPSSGQ